MKRVGPGILVAVLILPAAPLFAEHRAIPIDFANDDLPLAAKKLLRDHSRRIQEWSESESVVAAVRQQNAKPLDDEAVHAIDAEWIAGGDPRGLVERLMQNSCARYLRAKMSEHSGYIEGFATDERGNNVCMTQRTSDYWQGDEEKWSRSFEKGMIFVGKAEFDESAGTTLFQISVPVFDGDDVIGVLIVGKTVQIAGAGFYLGLKDD